MTMEAIRAELVSIVSGVAGTGKVYEYERFEVPPEDFSSVFEVAGSINYVTITWAGERRRLFTNMQSLYVHTFDLTFIREVIDPSGSGQVFQDYLSAVADAIDDDVTLGGTAETLFPRGDYLTMGMPEVLPFGEVRNVHVAALRVVVQELVNRQ